MPSCQVGTVLIVCLFWSCSSDLSPPLAVSPRPGAGLSCPCRTQSSSRLDPVQIASICLHLASGDRWTKRTSPSGSLFRFHEPANIRPLSLYAQIGSWTPSQPDHAGLDDLRSRTTLTQLLTLGLQLAGINPLNWDLVSLWTSLSWASRRFGLDPTSGCPRKVHHCDC